MNKTEIRKHVRDAYGDAVRQRPAASCCAPNPALYAAEDLHQIPEDASSFSLGCGNPTALAELAPGEQVLDLGSGGGLDVFLAAQRVGPRGHVFGLDMTDEMLELARTNQVKSGVTNATFLKGEIEDIPLPSNCLDVIMSNCVINLSADKDRVLAEAFRVLKAGGRLAISDMVTHEALPDDIRYDLEQWVGCVAGAVTIDEYKSKLRRAGFTDIRIGGAPEVADANGYECACGSDSVDSNLFSASIRAVKP